MSSFRNFSWNSSTLHYHKSCRRNIQRNCQRNSYENCQRNFGKSFEEIFINNKLPWWVFLFVYALTRVKKSVIRGLLQGMPSKILINKRNLSWVLSETRYRISSEIPSKIVTKNHPEIPLRLKKSIKVLFGNFLQGCL